MAKKTNKTRTEPTFEGMSYEQLRAELGFDELTYEACFRELFGEAFDLSPGSQEPPRAAKVTQMGPGRRNRPKGQD